MTPIVAFDNDAAGDKMAATMGDYGHLWPMGKDWNDDLIAGRQPPPPSAANESPAPSAPLRAPGD